MKNMKKLCSVLLALVMVLTMAVGAFAEMEGTLTDGSITINDAIPNQTYSAYQILYLESYNADSNAYAYKANSAWEEWLKTQTSYVTIDEQGYVTWVNGADVAEFAKLAQAQLSGKTADKSAVAPAAAEGTQYSAVTLSDLNLGYYLVDTTLGTICSLNTTKPDAIIEEKNEAPTVTKEVQEDSNRSWGESNDADVNQVVNFKATITVQKGAENYILHDTMSAGLTYTGVTSVKIGESDVGEQNYTVTAPCNDGCTFEVAFDNEYIAGLEAGTQIVVTYSATLNDKAQVGLPGNENKVKLQYGDETKPSYTPEDKTITYTWDLDILKYANGDKNKVLKDAKFVLLNSDKTKVATIVNGKVTGWVAVPASKDESITWPENTELTTNESGKIEIDGLDKDTYYLRETAAPAGYNKLKDDVKVVITGATSEGVSLTYSTLTKEVENKSGTELPSTGGMGTTLLYVVGGVLFVGAAVLLITKRRMNMD